MKDNQNNNNNPETDKIFDIEYLKNNKDELLNKDEIKKYNSLSHHELVRECILYKNQMKKGKYDFDNISKEYINYMVNSETEIKEVKKICKDVEKEKDKEIHKRRMAQGETVVVKEELNKKINDLIDDKRKSEEEHIKKDKIITELTEQSEIYKKQLSDTENKLLEITEQSEIYKRKLSETEDENNLLKKELSDVSEQVNITVEEKNKIYFEFEKSKKEQSKKDDKINELLESEQRLLNVNNNFVERFKKFEDKQNKIVEELTNKLSESEQEKQVIVNKYDQTFEKIKNKTNEIIKEKDEYKRENDELKNKLSETENSYKKEIDNLKNKLSETENKFKTLETEIKLNQTETNLNQSNIFYKIGGSELANDLTYKYKEITSENKKNKFINYDNNENETDRLIKEHHDKIKSNPKAYDKQLNKLMCRLKREKELVEDLKIIKLPTSEIPINKNEQYNNICTSTDYMLGYLIDEQKMNKLLNTIEENDDENNDNNDENDEIKINYKLSGKQNIIIESSTSDEYINVDELVSQDVKQENRPKTKINNKEQNNIFKKNDVNQNKMIGGCCIIDDGIKKIKINNVFTSITDQNIDLNDKKEINKIRNKKYKRLSRQKNKK